MKKNKLLILILMCLFVINVKADAGAPMIISHKVMVTNKEGAQCYSNTLGEKEDRIIKYGATLSVYTDIEGKYIFVEGDDYSCYVKYVDVSSKTQSFDINNSEVQNITPVKAIIMPSGGLNLRKGPSVTYSSVTIVPQYAVVTLSKSAGTFWYYAEYNGKFGWITSMNNYVGMEGKEVLVSYEKVKIYDSKRNSVLGTIPENTEITNYLKMSESSYYVIYNGIKGYIDSMKYKVESPGKIKLIKDVEIYDLKENHKKLTAGQELEYTMVRNNEFYVPEKNAFIYLQDADFEYITKANIKIKTSGYLGEGIFGEEKVENIVPTPIEDNEPENDVEPAKDNENKGMNSKEIIIICLLGGIFLALTALVIIKLVNSKKKNVIYHQVNNNNNMGIKRMNEGDKNE